MAQEINSPEEIDWAALDAENSDNALPGDAGDSPQSGGGAQLQAEGDLDIVHLLGVPLHITIEIGRAVFTISDILSMDKGSVIELHKKVGTPLNMMVNSRLAARGEIVVVNDKFAFKVTEVLDPNDRLSLLSA